MSSVALPSDVPVRRAALALVAGAVVAVIALVGWQTVQRAQVAGERDATAAYADALEPLANDAGRIVELGLKDTLTQVANAGAADPTLARSARSFQRQLTSVRSQIAALDEPDGPRVDGFVAAMDHYVRAAQALERAALASPSSRGAIVSEVTQAGRAGDEQWDSASAALQAHLRDVGLQPVGWLPS